MKTIIDKLNLFQKRINPARRIALGFALVIIGGALLLMLPIASKTGEVTPFFTTLFTSTSATCVTGLILVDTGAHYSFFGQLIILGLIQVGGLGFMMIITMVFLASNRHIGLRSRMVIAQSLGTDSLSGVVRIVKHTLILTAIIEGAGAFILACRFIPEFGVVKGIWYGIFHSVSAFCNAGFDVLGRGDSIVSYKYDPVVLITIALLIIVGGLGFMVWEDILQKRLKMSVYSRLVLITTGALLVLGTGGFMLFEYSNPETMGEDSFMSKLLSAFFQSATTRTAGFDSIGQAQLTEPSKFLSTVLMMVGGSSGSTAGGIKTATVIVLLSTLKSVLTGRKNVSVMKRNITSPTIRHAITLLGMWLILISSSSVAISCMEGLPLVDCFYETASAYDTVGLSCGVMLETGYISNTIMILLMYFGRVGVMTLSVMFISSQTKENAIEYPSTPMYVG